MLSDWTKAWTWLRILTENLCFLFLVCARGESRAGLFESCACRCHRHPHPETLPHPRLNPESACTCATGNHVICPFCSCCRFPCFAAVSTTAHWQQNPAENKWFIILCLFAGIFWVFFLRRICFWIRYGIQLIVEVFPRKICLSKGSGNSSSVVDFSV